MYPQQPPFNPANQQATAPLDINTAVTTASSIAAGGRGPVFCACPQCMTTVTTRVETKENEQVKNKVSQIRMIGTVMFGSFIFFVAIAGVGFALGTGWWLSLLGPVVMIPMVVGMIFVFRYMVGRQTEDFCDATHYCPLCGSVLGVSDGWTKMLEYSRMGRRYRHY